MDLEVAVLLNRLCSAASFSLGDVYCCMLCMMPGGETPFGVLPG